LRRFKHERLRTARGWRMDSSLKPDMVTSFQGGSMRITQLVAITVFALSACSSPLKLGMKVKPTKSQSFLACISQDSLNKAIEFDVAQDRATVDALFAHGTCTNAPGNNVYRVISINGDEVEFVAVNSPSSKGMWTADTSFEPAT
jgi:hypothetical protein